ncbi:hypothetical protein F8M41_005795 [Gigaspora margarita]|uniref:Uncharacterized protein n=1 Tax=Gigaspora margarita TaxID=4874 RepID=A0A8H4A5U4_GIGMA|nr:hypothetical protein F8M41_005795 [Gigaspora margarita]
MSTWSKEIQNQVIEQLQFKTWKITTVANELEPPEETTTPCFIRKVFGSGNNQNKINDIDEINNYFNESIAPVLSESADIYEW